MIRYRWFGPRSMVLIEYEDFHFQQYYSRHISRKLVTDFFFIIFHYLRYPWSVRSLHSNQQMASQLIDSLIKDKRSAVIQAQDVVF
jgi:hypothetical protein